MFDMIGGLGVEVGVLRDCWGEWRLEGEMEVIQLHVIHST